MKTKFFLIVTILLSPTLAFADCDKFTLVQAQEVSRVIAQNKNKLLDANGKKLKANSVCINNSSDKDVWTVSVNCSNGQSCKPINVSSIKIKSEYKDQPNYHIAEVANIPKSVCNVASTVSSDEADSNREANQ